MAVYSNDAGSANNVQSGDPGYEEDAGGAAGIYQQIVGRNKKAIGPNANAYNKQADNAQTNATGFSDLARNFKQDAPTITNQYQGEDRGAVQDNVGEERYLGQHLRDTMEGKDTTGAQAQIQQGTDAGIAAQLSMARSAKGGGAAQAGAYRAAQQQGAVQQAGVAAAAGQLQAKLASEAAGQATNLYGNIGSQLGNQYGLEQGSAIQQAQLQSASQGQQDQTRLGYGALGNNAQAGSLNALNGYTQGNLSAQGLQPGIDANNQGGKLIGTAAEAGGALLMMSDETVKDGIQSEGVNGGGNYPTLEEKKKKDAEEDAKTKKVAGILGGIGEAFNAPPPASSGGSVGGPGYTSDERAKVIDKGGSRVDAFLDGIHPLSYHYKQADLEPRSQPTGGRYLGISAQDLEAVPEVGHQLVSEGPRGKQVEIGPSLSAALAGIARLHERVKAVESGGAKSMETSSATRKATPGATEEGNINHYGRPSIENGDGTVSTVRSMSFNDGPGREVLIPTAYDGAVHSGDESIAHYRQTGQHMGVYKTPEAATAQAMRVHDDYENGRYADAGSHVLEQPERRHITSDMAAKTDITAEGAAPYIAHTTPRTVAPGTPRTLLDVRHKAGEAMPVASDSDQGFWTTTSGAHADSIAQHLAVGRAMDAARAGEAERLAAGRQRIADANAEFDAKPQARGAPIAHEPVPTGSFAEQLRDRFGTPPARGERLAASAMRGAEQGATHGGEPTLASLYSGGR